MQIDETAVQLLTDAVTSTVRGWHGATIYRGVIPLRDMYRVQRDLEKLAGRALRAVETPRKPVRLFSAKSLQALADARALGREMFYGIGKKRRVKK